MHARPSTPVNPRNTYYPDLIDDLPSLVKRANE
jgi:hypothetical protein